MKKLRLTMAACAVLAGILALASAPPARGQAYVQTNDLAVPFSTIAAGGASNTVALTAANGISVGTALEIPKGAKEIDLIVRFTSNTQLFWGAAFVFGTSADGSNFPTDPRDQLQLYMPTNALASISNYTGLVSFQRTNVHNRFVSPLRYIQLLGVTNNATPTPLTVDRVTAVFKFD